MPARVRIRRIENHSRAVRAESTQEKPVSVGHQLRNLDVAPKALVGFSASVDLIFQAFTSYTTNVAVGRCFTVPMSIDCRSLGGVGLGIEGIFRHSILYPLSGSGFTVVILNTRPRINENHFI